MLQANRGLPFIFLIFLFMIFFEPDLAGIIATILISISGIGIIAIPTGIIAGAFSQSISKKNK